MLVQFAEACVKPGSRPFRAFGRVVLEHKLQHAFGVDVQLGPQFVADRARGGSGTMLGDEGPIDVDPPARQLIQINHAIAHLRPHRIHTMLDGMALWIAM